MSAWRWRLLLFLCNLPATRRHLHRQRRLLLRARLRRPLGKHHRNLPVRQLPRAGAALLGSVALLQRSGLQDAEPHALH